MNKIRISSSVKGLDEILDGGLIPSSSYLIVGSPGTGKTILSIQFLFESSKRKSNCLFISLAEPVETIRRNIAAFGWDLSNINFYDLTKLLSDGLEGGEYKVFPASEVEQQPIWSHIYKAIDDYKPDSLVIDSVTVLRYLSVDEYQFRKQVQKLVNILSERKCTSLLLYDPVELEKETSLALAVDGVIYLRNTISTSRLIEHRTVEVLKQRGSNFLSGQHPMRITSEGIVVWPHWVEKLKKQPYERKILSSGISQLDELLGGGIFSGGCTLIVGPSGVGKTTLALQFLTVAAKDGIKGTFYSFEEDPASIQQRCNSVSIPLEKQIENNLISIKEINPLLQYPDEFLAQIRNDIEHNNVQFIVLDSMRGYELAMAEFGNVASHIQNIVNYSRRNKASIFIIAEQEKLTGDLQITDIGISYIADNVLMIRYAEFNGEIIKVINCLKKRIGDFQSELRELKITNNGIMVGNKLSSLQGILTGVPNATTNFTKKSKKV